MSLSAPNLADTDIVYGDFGFHAAHQPLLDASVPAPQCDYLPLIYAPAPQYPPLYSGKSLASPPPSPSDAVVDVVEMVPGLIGSAPTDTFVSLRGADETVGDPAFVEAVGPLDALALGQPAMPPPVASNTPTEKSICASTHASDPLEETLSIPHAKSGDSPCLQTQTPERLRRPMQKICWRLAARLKLDKPFRDLRTYEKKAGLVYILGLEEYAWWLRQYLVSVNLTPPGLKCEGTQSLLASNIRLQQELNNLRKGHANVLYLMNQEQSTLQAQNQRLKRIVADTNANFSQMANRTEGANARLLQEVKKLRSESARMKAVFNGTMDRLAADVQCEICAMLMMRPYTRGFPTDRLTRPVRVAVQLFSGNPACHMSSEMWQQQLQRQTRQDLENMYRRAFDVRSLAADVPRVSASIPPGVVAQPSSL
ncbi:hypothetical protein NM688_g8717 [Phlebia brevispora]|uniref:Uncharacterized protein n=1 Tax=Phlebia brevispora TaxID=194682 RepID=A0ACC1RT32_9APHY|nr:hypothetical protein NM688_g8717 [Phlebia brevispora]